MDFAINSRARGAKYGKNKSRTQLHNFYDVHASVPTVLPTSKRFPISPSSVGTPQQDQDVADIPADPPSPSPARSMRPAHVTSHSRSPISTSHDSRSASPLKSDTGTGKSTYDMLLSTYDMVSSSEDDDLEAMERRPTKKPRLSPPQPLKKPTSVKSVASNRERDEPAVHSVLTKKEKNVILQQKPETGNEKDASLGTNTKPRSTTQSISRSALNKSVVQSQLKPALKKATYGQKHKGMVSTDEPSGSETGQPLPTPRKSKTKLKPRALEPVTPRKLQQSIDSSDTSGASPSQLGIDHLMLTNDASPEPEMMSTASHAASSVSVLPRGRKRLIDRLDAAASQPNERAKVAATDFEQELERLQRGNEPEKPQSVLEVPKLGRTGSSQTCQTYGRSRNTYAKERSHLSDMVDDLDNMSTASSQGASQQLLSGLLPSGPSQLQSQLEIESDSSEDAPTFRLKSIYELKQAGTNNRLEKEVEDLMVDINPAGGTKALRIQALMQIMRKMSQEGFASFLFEHALDRLSAWSSSMKDKISKLLLGMVFWRLIHCSATSPPSLKQIIQCVVTNSSSLPPLDSIAQIARNRAENLSKSTIRDLIDFEQSVLLQGMLPAYEGEGVIPAAITLGVLNDSLRKIIDAGTIIPLPQSSYTQIVALLQQVSQPSADQAVKHAFVTKLALSLLQICAGPLEQDLGLSPAEYRGLGDTLGDVIHRSLTTHEGLVQSILHFSITLCNDRPHICEAMCASNLPSSLMEIIISRFMSLVNAAQDSQEVESAMLDSIILSLACLLNLTEHSDYVRRNFATSKSTNGKALNHLSLLVDIYTDTAPRVRSARTMEQGSGLVMVGYLSLLICNLCLDDILWHMVSTRLTASSTYRISDVVASAKELLIHLRTVEDADMGNTNGNAHDKGSASLDNFTMRFGEILSAVKLE